MRLETDNVSRSERISRLFKVMRISCYDAHQRLDNEVELVDLRITVLNNVQK